MEIGIHVYFIVNAGLTTTISTWFTWKRRTWGCFISNSFVKITSSILQSWQTMLRLVSGMVWSKGFVISLSTKPSSTKSRHFGTYLSKNSLKEAASSGLQIHNHNTPGSQHESRKLFAQEAYLALQTYANIFHSFESNRPLWTFVSPQICPSAGKSSLISRSQRLHVW